MFAVRAHAHTPRTTLARTPRQRAAQRLRITSHFRSTDLHTPLSLPPSAPPTPHSVYKPNQAKQAHACNHAPRLYVHRPRGRDEPLCPPSPPPPPPLPPRPPRARWARTRDLNIGTEQDKLPRPRPALLHESKSASPFSLADEHIRVCFCALGWAPTLSLTSNGAISSVRC